jgi:hypothetical protein
MAEATVFPGWKGTAPPRSIFSRGTHTSGPAGLTMWLVPGVDGWDPNGLNVSWTLGGPVLSGIVELLDSVG